MKETSYEVEEDPFVKSKVHLEHSQGGYRYTLSASRNDGVVLMPIQLAGDEKPTKPLAWTSLVSKLAAK